MEKKCEKHGVPFVKVHGIRYTHEKPQYENDVEHEDLNWEECPKCLEEKMSKSHPLL